MTRRTVIGVSVALAVAASSAAVATVSDDLRSTETVVGASDGPPPPGLPAQTAGQAQPVPERPPAPREDPQTVMARRRQERMAAANRPISQQRDEIAREHRIPPEEVERQARIVVTVGSPIGWGDFEAAQARNERVLPEGADKVGVYLEAPDGYPWRALGVLDTDFAARFEDHLERVANGGSPPPNAAPDSVKAFKSEQERAALMVGQVRDRLLVVGFVMPYEVFARSEDQIRSRYQPTAVEVTMRGDVMPLV